MAWTAVHSKSVILLWLLLLLLFVAPIVGFCVCSMFCCTLLCILSSFAVIMHDGEERAGWFILSVFLMSCYCYCSVALPHGAMGWSAVCDCGIS